LKSSLENFQGFFAIGGFIDLDALGAYAVTQTYTLNSRRGGQAFTFFVTLQVVMIRLFYLSWGLRNPHPFFGIYLEAVLQKIFIYEEFTDLKAKGHQVKNVVVHYQYPWPAITCL
jgi:hypothetical protein